MTTNPSPTTQHFAAGPHQDWPRLPEGALLRALFPQTFQVAGIQSWMRLNFTR